jgi:hypothetical protein
MKLTIFVAFALGLLPLMASAMTVSVEQPSLYDLAAGNKSRKIFLDGPIDRKSLALVQDALEKAGDNGADVYFNSPGGNLLSGIEIGRLIRRHGASTILGKRRPGADLTILPAECYSACSLAFIGSVYRYSGTESIYGVHRFASTTGPSDDDLDMAQILSAAISTYIREMGVDPRLFDLMASTSKDEISVINSEEMKKLQIVNNGRQQSEWTIEANGGTQYLKGEQTTVYGAAKAIFNCERGQLMFHSFYEAGERSQSIAAGGWHHSLSINNKNQPLTPFELQVSNRFLVTSFEISRNDAIAISQAKSVGHAMQVAPDAPTFVGYRIEIDGDRNRQRVSGFIASCSSAAH